MYKYYGKKVLVYEYISKTIIILYNNTLRLGDCKNYRKSITLINI